MDILLKKNFEGHVNKLAYRHTFLQGSNSSIEAGEIMNISKELTRYKHLKKPKVKMFKNMTTTHQLALSI